MASAFAAAAAVGIAAICGAGGMASRTAADVMSGSGATVAVRTEPLGSGCHGLGSPTDSLLKGNGPLFSSVASATNRNATRTEPTIAKYDRIGIVHSRL